ncbi:hypothetical protein [Sphingomonas crocodyli]|uniref:Uncharacterized protein n=1 Tax=Sphingomonas crocodyli TaxID=1979270 RepID=A0A437M997_9SPHN|nr:hypothetical protein [Sphingomonas crocodyli]RVT94167.1 hypothetical protein EOD43_10030 [Sphingomonas crocodyli]
MITDALEMLATARAEGRKPQGWRVSHDFISGLVGSGERYRFVRTEAGWSWRGLPIVAVAGQGAQLSY